MQRTQRGRHGRDARRLAWPEWAALRRRPGQALVLGALTMTVLVAMTGLTVDVGVWLVAKARLQRAVDAAALSVVLDRPTPAQTGGTALVATQKARQLVTNQGIPLADLTAISTAVPRSNQLTVQASQWVPTAFARIIGVTGTTLTATATADINAYIEIPVSPICGGALSGSSVVCDGGVGDSTMDQFGRNRPHSNGDAYTNPTSPYYAGPDGQPVLPNGYLYRVDVGSGYTGALDIQVFDVDGFNKDNPPRWLNPCPPAVLGDPCNSVANPTFLALNDLRQWSGNSYPSVARDYYAAGYHLFWRVDECNNSGQTCQAAADMTPIEFTLWYLNADALDALNPLPSEQTMIQTRSFGPTAASCRINASDPDCTDVYTCSGTGNQSTCPDLRWMRLFHIPDVTAYTARVDGSRSFYIYVRAVGNTNTENVYQLRSGPPPGDAAQQGCQPSGVGGRSNYFDVNVQVSCTWNNGRTAANSNTKIYARRSMPVNVMQAATGGVPYVVWLGYIPRTAAGQTLLLRDYDLDRPTACPPQAASNRVQYTAWFPSDGRRTDLITACGSSNGNWQETLWTATTWDGTNSDAFWGGDQGFWLYANIFQKSGGTDPTLNNGGYSPDGPACNGGGGNCPFWDTAVFEVIFNRARLVR